MVEVIDSSVAIKWFVLEDGRIAALEILQKLLTKPEDFFVPELFYFELLHVLYKVVGKEERQQHLLHKIIDLPIGRMPMNKKILTSSLKYQVLGLSGYDAAYVAVAEIVEGQWLTYDKKAHDQIAHLALSRCLA